MWEIGWGIAIICVGASAGMVSFIYGVGVLRAKRIDDRIKELDKAFDKTISDKIDVVDRRISENCQAVKSHKQEIKEQLGKLDADINLIRTSQLPELRLISRCRVIHSEIDEKWSASLEALRNDFKPIQQLVIELIAVEKEKKKFHKGFDGYPARMTRIEENQGKMTKILKELLKGNR